MDYQEIFENLSHYNLAELTQEAIVFDISNIENLTKDELIMEIMKVSVIIVNNTLQSVISELMTNDKNGTWYQVKTIAHMKECLLSAMEGYHEDEESYLFYMKMCKILEDLQY